MDRAVGAHRLVDGREEGLFAEAREKPEALELILPPHYKRFQYFICGPARMKDAIESALSVLGVPPQHIHSERFEMV